MNTTNLLKIAFRALANNKLRGFLTMLGIIIGVASVITMLAIGHLVTFMHQSVSQAHGDQGVDRLLPTLGRFISRIVHERKLYVLYRCRLRQQIVILKNESDLAIPEGRSLPLVHGAHGYSV